MISISVECMCVQICIYKELHSSKWNYDILVCEYCNSGPTGLLPHSFCSCSLCRHTHIHTNKSLHLCIPRQSSLWPWAVLCRVYIEINANSSQFFSLLSCWFCCCFQLFFSNKCLFPLSALTIHDLYTVRSLLCWLVW